MLFEVIVSSVCERMPASLSSAAATTRIGHYVNQRYRQVQTSVSLAATRRTTVTYATVSGSAAVTVTGVAKLLDVYDPLNRIVLDERSLDQLRREDPGSDLVGIPRRYAIYSHVNDRVVLTLSPTPTAVGSLTSDAIAAGTEMVAGDSPAFPTDFHDVLIWGALADECAKQEKLKLSEMNETKFIARTNDLRYFIAKSAYLKLQQTDPQRFYGPRVWLSPYGAY